MWGRDGGPALLQEFDSGGSGELFVEGDDLVRAVGEADLGNQVVGETAARRAGGFAGLAGEVGGFGGDAAGAEQAFEGVEDSFRAPAGAKDPGKLGEDNEGQEDAASGARLGQGAACALGLGRVVVEEGTRPDVGVGDDHREALRTLARFISAKVMAGVMTGPGLPAWPD